jgi:hypothetical protein
MHPLVISTHQKEDHSPKNQQNNHNSKNHLTGDGKTPIDRAGHIRHPIVEPVCNHDTDPDEQRLATHVLASFFGFAEFGLIYGDGGRFDAGANARDEAAY